MPEPAIDTILVLDFGGQTCQLIARRIRECGVYSRVLPGDVRLAEVDRFDQVRGIVLSGSPASVHDRGAPRPDDGLLRCGVPVLGICYGMQHLMHADGGVVSAAHVSEYGRARVERVGESPLFAGMPATFHSWMSHGDAVERIGGSFRRVAGSEYGAIAAVESVDPAAAPVYGIQFHPEVSHTEYGSHILANFATTICGARRQWNLTSFEQRATAELRATVGAQPVVLMISGGVDSTVVAALLLKALPADQVHLLYVDTGLMRLRETEEVQAILHGLGATHVQVVDAAERFYAALAGATDPEEKRRIIGDLFIEVQRDAVRQECSDGFLAQGTLYTDLIESGRGVGAKAHVIKSHHNVAAPLVVERRNAGLLLEPLASLYKDEVRRLGEALGVPATVIARHPFPGPGLAVRILGEVTRERCDLLREVDAIYLQELRSRGLYDQVTQAFAVLLPVRSVGVTGDSRRYGEVVALRAVVSDDFMTAEVFPFEPAALLEISARITNEIAAVGRVVYDVSSKPPATVEWE
jgi:GMP synthase (glutamine-hydrolysing)